MERPGAAERTVRAGPWRHVPPPSRHPRWLDRGSSSGFSRRRRVCVARRAGGLASQRSRRRADAGWTTLRHRGSARRHRPRRAARRPHDRQDGRHRLSDAAAAGRRSRLTAQRRGSVLSLFRESVAFMDCANWATGQVGRVTVGLERAGAPPVHRMSSAGQLPSVAECSLSHPGGARRPVAGRAGRRARLGRGRSGAVDHVGGARAVRRHRARRGRATSATGSTIDSRDQLGDLATSFNR